MAGTVDVILVLRQNLAFLKVFKVLQYFEKKKTKKKKKKKKKKKPITFPWQFQPVWTTG